MENAIVTFKDKDTNNSITIDLQYDKDSSTVDYNLKLSDNYNPKSDMDFIGFLAHMFLQSLQLEDKENGD